MAAAGGVSTGLTALQSFLGLDWIDWENVSPIQKATGVPANALPCG